MLSVLYRLLFFAMVSYDSTMGPMGRPSCRSSSGAGCGASSSLRITTTVMPAQPRFFCAPKKMAA